MTTRSQEKQKQQNGSDLPRSVEAWKKLGNANRDLNWGREDRRREAILAENLYFV